MLLRLVTFLAPSYVTTSLLTNNVFNELPVQYLHISVLPISPDVHISYVSGIQSPFDH